MKIKSPQRQKDVGDFLYLKKIKMKKLIFLLFISFAFTSFQSDDVKSKLIGEWIGEDKGEIGKIVFQKNDYAFFEYQNEIFGGESFMLDGKKGAMKFSIEDKKTPFDIDLIVSFEGTKLERKLLCIGKFIAKNKMQFAIGFDGERPQGFNKENSLIFNKNE